MTASERRKELDLCRTYVESLKSEFESLGIYIRRIKQYPFDTIGLGVLNKVFSLSDSIFLLLDAGMEDQAYALCRSIVDCSLNLRYMTESRDELFARTMKYINFEKQEKQYWMHWAIETFGDTPRGDAIKEYGDQYGLSPDPKGASKHWSGKVGFPKLANLVEHPLDGDGTTELGKNMQYAVDYSQTSAYVHCSAPALDSFWPDSGEEFRIGQRSGRTRFQQITRIIVVYAYNCVAYCLWGLGMRRPDVFGKLHADTLKSLVPYETPISVKSAHSCAV